MQHWMYAASYLYVALVLRLTFTNQNFHDTSTHLNEVIRRERVLSRMNGLIYLVLLAALFAELFINNGDAIMDFVDTFFAIAMTGTMIFSVRRVVRFLKHLSRRGILPATKTIIVQLVFITLASILNFVSYFAELKFNQ